MPAHGVYTWPSLAEFAAHAERAHDPRGQYTGSRTYPAGKSWDLGVGFDGAVRLARNGWPKGMARVRPLADALVARIDSRISRLTWDADTTGAILDIGAYCAGEPEHWYTPRMVDDDGRDNRTVRVVVNLAASAAIDADALAARGAAVMALAECLTLAGRTVAVEAVGGYARTRGAAAYHEQRVTLKAPDAPLDADRLVFALAHYGMFRRLSFAVAEASPEIDALGAAYGYPGQIDDRGDIYIAAVSSIDVGAWSPAKAERWILDTLREQGVRLAGDDENSAPST